jgi:hypothetical protein
MRGRWRWTGVLLFVLLAAGPAPAADLEVTAPPEIAWARARVEAMSLDALATDLDRAGLGLPAEIHVMLLPDGDPRARTVPDWIVGLAFGQREIVLFPERVLPYPYDSLESVIRHEIVHLALNVRAGGRPLPRWLHEGLAITVDTGWGTGGQLRLLLGAMGSPRTADLGRLFASGNRGEASDAYGLSAALVADIQRRHGHAAPAAIAGRVGAGMSFVEAFRLETGETPDAAAARAWAGYRRVAAWVPALTSATALWAGILALAFVAFLVRARQRALRRQAWDDEDWTVH